MDDKYRERMQRPDWQAVRQAVLKRDRHRCQVCGAQGVGLVVHHTSYERLGAEDPKWDLVALCRRCHDLVPQMRAVRKDKGHEAVAQLMNAEAVPVRNGGWPAFDPTGYPGMEAELEALGEVVEEDLERATEWTPALAKERLAWL